MSEEVAAFARLFRGRIDCYGSWDGACVKEPLTLEKYHQHLTSADPADWIGVYPLGKDMCSWGCIDIDGGDFPATFPKTIDGQVVEVSVTQHPDYDRKDPQWHDWDAMLDLATNLTVILEAKDIWGHIEQTRNGYHVWVFPEDKLVAAKTMRRALMAACTAIGYKPNEVNPKSESLGDGKVGNYVRTCYPGGLSEISLPAPTASRPRQELDAREPGVARWVARGGREFLPRNSEGSAAEVSHLAADVRQGRRRPSEGGGWCGWCGYMWGPFEALPRQELEGHLALPSAGAEGGGGAGEGPSPLDGFSPSPGDPRRPSRVLIDHISGTPLCVKCALQSYELTSTEALEEVSRLWTPPTRAWEVDPTAGLEAEPIIRKLNALGYTIWRDGPLPGSDRSSTLAHLSHLCQESGLTVDEAFTVVRSADERHGRKFADREDGDERIAEMCERAYAT
jgi:hypothetical protein